jgi:4-hydroxy-4-methyl-2-oxoglutarate aldolase
MPMRMAKLLGRIFGIDSQARQRWQNALVRFAIVICPFCSVEVLGWHGPQHHLDFLYNQYEYGQYSSYDQPGQSDMNHTMADLRKQLYSAVVADALDQLGFRHQSPRVGLSPLTTTNSVLMGRCKTTLWADMAHVDPRPYELELKAVDECQPDDILIAAANGSMRSGIWGELLTTAALNRGCVGAIVDGAIRDVNVISSMSFPVWARGTCVYDSLNRQRVIDIDVVVEIEGVCFAPGSLVIADRDGIVVVPQSVEEEALRLALAKVQGENIVRDAIRQGMKATDAFQKYGIL